jgi:hypothetical protein
MKIYVLLPSVVFVGTLALTHPAHGKTISIKGHGPGQVKAGCGKGGASFPPNDNGVYGCLRADGSGIVCGGTGKDAKTCDTWGPDHAARLAPGAKPSQEEFDRHAATRINHP